MTLLCKTVSQYYNTKVFAKEIFLLLKTNKRHIKIQNEQTPTAATSPGALRFWGSSQRQKSQTTVTTNPRWSRATEKSGTEEKRRGEGSGRQEAIIHFVHQKLWGNTAPWYMLPWFLLLLPPLDSNLFKTSSTSFRTKWDFEMERDVRSEVLASSKYP